MKLRTVLDTREWDIQAELIERITEEITNSEGSQRQLAEELGILYSGNTTDSKLIHCVQHLAACLS
ncbi:hypothetical protein Pst134EA_007418 [Puccinia striiformis f. sp. tritici]|uniref:hypothetical protein n=1 Tax=Puccinia striiformis f. sp. tritici TaxID=168172 RepID=UPI0020076A3D|nr:hypothetical protein Pst134EA_007418 [Puccinia striiformis f. sp. tritici]KAH9470153.1 hypothetical protein Pst134EA_007418 [Puccinia striiformis f. sp. tritici]